MTQPEQYKHSSISNQNKQMDMTTQVTTNDFYEVVVKRELSLETETCMGLLHQQILRSWNNSEIIIDIFKFIY